MVPGVKKYVKNTHASGIRNFLPGAPLHVQSEHRPTRGHVQNP